MTGKLALDALAEQLAIAYPRRQIVQGSGFVFVTPCELCGHTRCGADCACACNTPREALS